jgi:hypothetical protein
MKERKVAVIYPLLHEHIERIFQGKDIFCKYVGKGIPRIGFGSKLLFYVSGSRSEIVGEATIEAVEFLTPDEIIARYENRLFITKEELDNYRKLRDRPPDRKLIVLSLSKIRKYDRPRRMPKVVTMAGRTLSKDEYRQISI